MQNLFLELSLLISLAVIVYLMAAAVPRIEEEETEGDDKKRSSLPLDKLDDFLIRNRDKFLRRMKVLVMKTDNLISKQLKSKKE